MVLAGRNVEGIGSLLGDRTLAASLICSRWELSFVIAVSDAASTLFGTTSVCSSDLLFGRAICDEIIAGSTGAPATVALPVGGRRAGGVYLF